MKAIRSIAGINLHYARTNQFPYGSIGRPATFYIDIDFYNKLNTCFEEVFTYCPLKKPKVITCAGIYVNKAYSQHKYGKAFDFDASFWSNFNFITRNFQQDFELYIGIESFLRKHFGIVLGYFYNNHHKDHFHINSGATLGFDKRQRSKVLYVQASLKYIYKYDIEVDGSYGPQTHRTFIHVLRRLGIEDGYISKQKWYEFLTKTGIISFRLFKSKHSPNRILNNIYAMVNELQISSDEKFQIFNSLNELQENEGIQEILVESNEENALEQLIIDVNIEV